MTIYLVGFILFIMNVTVIELLVFALKNRRNPNRSKIQKRLRKYSYSRSADGQDDILKKRILSDIPFLNSVLIRTPGIQRLDRLIMQANGSYPLGIYLMLSLLMGIAGYQACRALEMPTGPSSAAGVIGLLLPYLYLWRLKARRMKKFRSQFPESLGLIARSMKAGHAFSNSIKLAADHFEDPLGTEFEEIIDEINFGVTVADALKHLSDRIDIPEIKFFIIAVIIQRETGGNLAELMESIAHLIRKKLEFQRTLKTLTAEVRLSAVILSILPFVVILWFNYSKPSYLTVMLETSAGRLITMGASVLLVTGIIAMKLLVRVKV